VTTDMSVAETKRRFSDLLNRVQVGGESFVITRRGRRVACLTPVDAGVSSSKAGDAPRRGLLAAVGAWEGYEDIDEMVRELRQRRESATDREVPELR